MDELVKRLRISAQWADKGLVISPSVCLEAADAIGELLQKVQQLPRWIPVTELLPKEWWPVLGLIQYHDEKEPPSQQVLWYLGNGHWRETWRGDMIESDVTHWMPLPEPPKEAP